MSKGLPWSKEDLEIIKQYGKEMDFEELKNKLSIPRTTKSIKHKLSQFKIYKRNTVIKNYNIIKYKYIDNMLYKLCKRCGRYLPNSFDYYPKDSMCNDGLRNVCKECKGEFFKINSNVYIFNDEEISLLFKFYPHMSNKELIEKYFPYLSTDKIIRKANSLKIYKTEETLNKIAKDLGKVKSEKLLSLEKWVGEDNPQYNSGRFGELNPNYKGGVSQLYNELRRNIKQWKIDSIENCNYKCIITGKSLIVFIMFILLII